MVEFIEAGRESRHHMMTRALLLLAIDVVTQSIIKHCLKLTPLTFSNST